MSKIKQRKNKKQVKLVVGLTICLLLIMTVGYAAFSTQLSINAKGNIKTLTAANFLAEKVVTEGDGLYIAEEASTLRSAADKKKYIYKGTDPDNYITFNNETWRIISVEKDGSVKIIKESPLETELPWNSNQSNTWEDATIQTYLNNTYLNQLEDSARKITLEYSFNIGTIMAATETTPITNKELQIAEATKSWNGYIGLISLSDYMAASNDSSCITVAVLNTESSPCQKNNYLYKENEKFWLINSVAENTNQAWHMNDLLEPKLTADQSYIYPVLYLDGNISLQGDGTIISPYTIKSSN